MIQRLAPWALVHRPYCTTGAALTIEHQHHRQQQQAGQLRGAGQAVKAVPGFVDGRGEGVEVEHRYGTKICQGFHNRQRQTGTNSRSCHRQGHAPECAPWAEAEHPRRFHQALALGQKSVTREQINIGIKHQHQDDDHPAGGAHPEAHVVAKPLTQLSLQRAGKVQQADKDKGQHISWDGKRQHQRPVQPAPTGEFTQAGQPRQADAQQRHAHAHAEHQHQGVAKQPGQLGLPQMRPNLPVDLMPAEQQHTQRQ